MASLYSFSIPNRIEPSATGAARANRPSPGTFSIPNRIEPSATCTGQRSGRLPNHFQYPQSDRALCNSPPSSGCCGKTRLSVSPIGSSPLQRPICRPTSGTNTTFSIPNRIEPSATSIRDIPTTWPTTFSIPNRIEPSATLPLPSPPTVLLHFQYPQSDRALCNFSLYCLVSAR